MESQFAALDKKYQLQDLLTFQMKMIQFFKGKKFEGRAQPQCSSGQVGQDAAENGTASEAAAGGGLPKAENLKTLKEKSSSLEESSDWEDLDNFLIDENVIGQ